MNPKKLLQAQVDDQGRLVLPAEVSLRLGIEPGSVVEIEEGFNHYRVLRSIHQIARINLEVTNICNLDCVTCMRNIWDEPLGQMSEAVFERLLTGIEQIRPQPSVLIGGLGEPLLHPKIIDWVARISGTGASVELITNGIRLDEERIVGLTDAGLDILWVSLDGATPESYSDIRLGASLNKVIGNLKKLRTLRHKSGYQHDPKPELGIAFVAMKRNIADLPEIFRLGTRLGAKHFSISNLLPHTEAMQQEILFQRTQSHHGYWKGTGLAQINLPRIDVSQWTQAPFLDIYSRQVVLKQAGHPINQSMNTCPFIERGSLSVRWDGAVSPCIPLLHSNCSFLGMQLRTTYAHTIGNLRDRDLAELWNDPGYVEFRNKVRHFNFSPCISCTRCDLSKENREDCLSNRFPTCGGCLYAQGLIQCP